MFFFLGGLPFLIIGIAFIALLAGKAEPDPDHERPRALYLAAASYIAVLVLLAASFFVFEGLLGFSDKDSGSVTFSMDDDFDGSGYRIKENHDDDVSGVVGGLIAGALAVGVLAFHLPKLRDTAPDGPGARVYSRYLYLACFAALLAGLFSFGGAIYQLLAGVAPDTLGNGDRADALRSVATGLGVSAVAAAVFVRHWRFSEALRAARNPAPVAE